MTFSQYFSSLDDEPAEMFITIIEFLSPQIINHIKILQCPSSQGLIHPQCLLTSIISHEITRLVLGPCALSKYNISNHVYSPMSPKIAEKHI